MPTPASCCPRDCRSSPSRAVEQRSAVASLGSRGSRPFLFASRAVTVRATLLHARARHGCPCASLECVRSLTDSAVDIARTEAPATALVPSLAQTLSLAPALPALVLSERIAVDSGAQSTPLPNELKAMILAHVDTLLSLGRLAQTSRDWHHAVMALVGDAVGRAC